MTTFVELSNEQLIEMYKAKADDMSYWNRGKNFEVCLF